MIRQIATLGIAVMLAAVLLGPDRFASAQSNFTVYVDGQIVTFDVPPTMVDGRVLVPLRGIFERLGATVDYDGRTQHIVAVRGAQTVELTIGSRQARVNESATLLDVPAVSIDGRAMVPLRFVSESLGASVQWLEANHTILIGSSGVAAAPPPSAPPVAAVPPPPPPLPAPTVSTPPPQTVSTPPPQTVSGDLVAVSSGSTPRIVVRADGQDRTLVVMPSTAIFRYNAETNGGGSSALGSLRKGDQVTVQVNPQNEATKITATYRVPAAGKIANVSAANRAVTLTDGRTYVVLRDADVTLDGAPADFAALQAGRIVGFSVVEGTNQAYEAHVRVPPPATAAAPAPAVVSAPTIMAPSNGDTVAAAFAVRGKAQAGALVVVKAQPKLLGEAAQAQTTAGPDGSWTVNVNVSALPFVAFPYVVSAVQVVRGTQSDPASVEVSVR